MIVVEFNENNEGSAHDSVDHHGGYDFSTKNKNGEETPKFNSAMKMIVNILNNRRSHTFYKPVHLQSVTML